MSFDIRSPKVLYPLVTIAASLLLALLLVVAKPQAEPEIHSPPAPLVRVVEAVAGDVELVVRAQGRVAPRTEIDLVAEVSGKVAEVAPSLAAGGFFATGDVLVRIEHRDYELAVERGKAEVARAEVAVAMEEAEAEVAVREWKSLREGEPPALVARGPQLAEARARLAAASAALEQAEIDLGRTRVKAPFDGRVRQESVDVGQFVGRGSVLARIYSTDAAEIRIPLPDVELAYLDLPLAYRGESAEAEGPRAVVAADFAGRRYRWEGRIVRTEGQIDATTHMVHAVARVDDPYGKPGEGDRPPLAAGMFVDVEVAGRTLAGVVSVPRTALRGRDQVLVVEGGATLRVRSVEIARREHDRVLISKGLAGGEQVCISPLDVAVDGMAVRVADAEAGA